MPIRSNLRSKKPQKNRILSRRSTKSVSPQKNRFTHDLDNLKHHDSSYEIDSDPGLAEINQLDTSSSLLKQLHSDFNKKYISDNVTLEAKLRWNRQLYKSPCRSDNQNIPLNMFLEKVKLSPQIPSPIYSPIKKKPKENKPNILQISFETPPSSDESISPKPGSIRRKQTLRTSNKILSPSQDFLEPFIHEEGNSNKKTINRIMKNYKSVNFVNQGSTENSTKKLNSPKLSRHRVENKNLSGRKNTRKTLDQSANYFIEERHLHLENVLETESEKSDLQVLRSPGSISTGALSISSPESKNPLEFQAEDIFFQKAHSQSEIQNQFKNNSLKNSLEIYKNEKIFENSKPDLTTKLDLDNTELMSRNEKQKKREDVTNSSVINESYKNNVLPDVQSELTLNFLELNNKNTNKRSNSLMQNEKSVDPVSQIDNAKEENASLTQNNDPFHCAIIHNRISSLKSPFSADSAHGSSIDVETNYHPKHCEVFWGQKGNFPYWPCLIWPDPEGKTLRIQKQGSRQYISYHVKFFADNGQRSWINKDNLIAYNGREDFDRRAKEQSLKMKSSAYKKYFVVSKPKLPIWEQAVTEADKILSVHIEKRAEFFNEILNESIELLRQHRQQRRFSMNIERSSSRQSNNSLVESSEELMNSSGVSSSFSVVSKRRRPSTAYENLPKRHKIESDSEDLFQQSSSITTVNIYSNKFLFPKELIDVMADYTLRTTESEGSFQRFEKCCIELFNIFKDSTHEEYDKGSSVKKHPNRTLRKKLISSLQKSYNEILSEPIVEKKKNKRLVSDIPSIQTVLKDIVELLEDKRYLFRHLKNGPVCKICLKPNDLVKCDGVCDSSIHKNCLKFTAEEYLDKLKLDLRKKKGKKPFINNGSFQRKIENQSFLHVTGETDDNVISTCTIEESKTKIDSEAGEATLNLISEKVYCKECLTNNEPVCLICKKGDKQPLASIENNEHLEHLTEYKENRLNLTKCKLPSCNKIYHIECLRVWPQANITKSTEVTNTGSTLFETFKLICPSHTCHTCALDDPHPIQLKKNNIIKCVKCPATYHSCSKCIPAGTEFLTANFIICPRHNFETKPTNTDWCFLCSGSGNLICCDTCPSSFHLSCINLNQTPTEKFLCELCESGRLPLYGDLVWCKFGQYKWWPSVIIPPIIIPKNLYNKTHSRFGFCVRFLGTNDYGWTGRHRVYLYQEDDYSFDKKKDKLLQKAIDEAKIAWEYFEINKPKESSNDDNFTPVPYKKIKNNLPLPPVKLDYNISELNPCNCLPESSSPCGYNSQCLNRVLMIECNPKICPAKLNCENQMFEKRQYAPITIRKTVGKGFGLISTAPIQAGTFIIEYVGELIDDNELKRRIEEKQKQKDPHYYFFSIESNLTIDAGLKGNLARFMNHSCEPNCEPQMWTVNGVKRIGLFSKYDVKEGTELTFHYNFECIGDNKDACFCRADNCKGFIGGIYNKKTNDSKNLNQEKNDLTQKNSEIKGKKMLK